MHITATQRRRQGQRSGFSLLHVLVVVLILAFLISILLPSLCRSTESANRIKCASNLRLLGQALQLYRDDNGGVLPRTVFDESGDAVPVFFTNARAQNPFAADGPGPNDVTAALYLLLREDVIPQMLICPSSTDEVLAQPSVAPSNFVEARSLSYSYQNPYSPFNSSAPPTRTSTQRAHADFALAADINPGGPALLATPATAPREKVLAINSPNHSGQGQNVLYQDGHADWHVTPFAGMSRHAAPTTPRDNIYHAGGAGTAAPARIAAAPADAADNVLLPVSPSGPASSAMSVRRVGGVRQIVWLGAAIAGGIGVVAALLIVRVRRRRRRPRATSP